MFNFFQKKIIKQLSWSFYLAGSWTWCIGMFLPAILNKDFGAGSWLLFATCNIVGATAFGYVIKTHQQSQTFIAHHAVACRVFSLVTLLFHTFFIGWIARQLGVDNWAVIFLFLILLCYVTKSQSVMRYAAIVIWIMSVSVFVYYLNRQSAGLFNTVLFEEFTLLNAEHSYLLVILAFGFLLCPYLDLSFHQAISTEGASVSQPRFLIAFPVLFLTLLLFSLAYRGEITTALLQENAPVQKRSIGLWLFYYLLMQSGFTLMVHFQRLQNQVSQRNIYYVLLSFAIVAIVMMVSATWDVKVILADMSINEFIYRCFIGYYAVIAPAYIWFFARNSGTTVSKKTAILATSVALTCISVPMLTGNNAFNPMYLLAVITILVTDYLGRKIAIKNKP